jgi:TolA-binding protein
MADTADDKPTAAKSPGRAEDDNAIDTMQKQIGQMRREISSLKRLVAEQAEEVVEDAEGWFDTASEGASRATQALRSQAQKVSGTVQDNPVTVSSALFVGGIIGFLIGMALGSSEAAHRRWYERY